MIENLQSINVFSPTVAEILSNIFISLICSFLISLIYRFTYKGPGYSTSFVNSIVFLSLITALVIMVIGNNLARAFGLVGALSIIRFRTAIKDTVDIVYIFLALAIGMASGVGYHKLAIVGTIVIGFILLVFSTQKFSITINNQYVLQFTYKNGEPDISHLTQLLQKYCRSYEIINIRSNDIEHSFEYSFYIKMKRDKNANYLLDDLRKIEGVRSLNIFFDQQNS